MGYYIFDSHEVGAKGKLALLRKLPGITALPHLGTPSEVDPHHVTYPVCWVDNGLFEAVGIAIDDQELRRFVTGMSGRPHQWFIVPTDELVKLKPHLAEYLRRERSWRE